MGSSCQRSYIQMYASFCGGKEISALCSFAVTCHNGADSCVAHNIPYIQVDKFNDETAPMMDWNVKKIRNHLICACFGGSKNLSHPPIAGICYGFANMDEINEYLVAGNISLKQASESILITILSLLSPFGIIIIFFIITP